jgi:glycosyltransferase involved in cell wall biosynthesis
LLYRYGLRHADMIIVQTQAQQAALKAAFGLGAKVIPMPCPEPAHAYDRAPHLDSKATRVLWIARICKQKRPDRFLDLAQACPDIQFDLAGPVYPDAYAQSVYARAIQIPNVTVHGPVGRDQVPALYQHAACLCSTSDFEGFPNTFLEAWSHGLPIVSTFDPDSLISKRNLGIVAKDIPGFQSALRSLLGSPDRYRQISHNARKYFLENHRSEVVMPKFEEVFLDLCKGSNGQVVTEQAQSLEASVLS